MDGSALGGRHDYITLSARGSACAVIDNDWRSFSALHVGWLNFFRNFGCEAVFPIIANRLLDNRAAIHTLPSIKGQEEI